MDQRVKNNYMANILYNIPYFQKYKTPFTLNYDKQTIEINNSMELKSFDYDKNIRKTKAMYKGQQCIRVNNLKLSRKKNKKKKQTRETNGLLSITIGDLKPHTNYCIIGFLFGMLNNILLQDIFIKLKNETINLSKIFNNDKIEKVNYIYSFVKLKDETKITIFLKYNLNSLNDNRVHFTSFVDKFLCIDTSDEKFKNEFKKCQIIDNKKIRYVICNSHME